MIVKIQRPNIEAQVENDLEILLGLAKLIGRVPEARQIGLVAVIEDFAKLLRRNGLRSGIPQYRTGAA